MKQLILALDGQVDISTIVINRNKVFLNKEQRQVAKKNMTKLTSILCILLFSFYNANSQVGTSYNKSNINLEIKSNSIEKQRCKINMLIPRLNDFPTTIPIIFKDSMIIFIVDNGKKHKGFYYWDHITLSWVPVGSKKSIKKANR